jgi:hypothetical protein
MSRKLPKPAKTAVVAFKVEEELADFLNQLPNKSAFIRKAIAAQMSMACPLCAGSGQVTRWTHDHYAPLLAKWNKQKCEGCGDDLTLPRDPGDLTEEHQIRLEQYFNGGPLLCDPCYDKSPACDDCGWHISEDQVKKHKHAHAHN